MKLLISFIMTFASMTAYSQDCGVSYTQEVNMGLTESENSSLMIFARRYLNEKENIIIVDQEFSEYSISTNTTKDSDAHDGSYLYPHTWMDLNRTRDTAGIMHTSGIGKVSRKERKAYSYKSAKKSIRDAIRDVNCEDLKDLYREHLGYTRENDSRDWLY